MLPVAEKNSLASDPSISISCLAKIKRTALRRGIWFKTLNHLERSLIDLTTKYVDNIKSAKLANVLTAIIQKLSQHLENTLQRLVRTIGLPLAKKISEIAIRLGNISANSWAEDIFFAKYLAMNSSSG